MPLTQDSAQTGEERTATMGPEPAARPAVDCSPFSQQVMRSHFQFSISPEATILVVTGQIIIPAGIHYHENMSSSFPSRPSPRRGQTTGLSKPGRTRCELFLSQPQARGIQEDDTEATVCKGVTERGQCSLIKVGSLPAYTVVARR